MRSQKLKFKRIIFWKRKMKINKIMTTLNFNKSIMLVIFQLYNQFKRMIFKKKKQISPLKIVTKYNVVSLI